MPPTFTAGRIDRTTIVLSGFTLERRSGWFLTFVVRQFKNNRLWPILAIITLVLSTGLASADDTNAILQVWRLRMPDHTMVTKSACAVAPDKTIYQGTRSGLLLAITPDGAIKWTYQAGLEIWSSPAVADDGTIYFGSRDRNLYALAPDGKLKWKYLTGAWIDSSPAIGTDGTVYFGSWDHNFYALTAGGQLKWKFATDALITSSPAVATDGTIYFGSHDQKLYALTADGKLKWAFKSRAEIDSSPAIAADGTAYISSTDGNLYAVHPDGSEAWHLHTGGFTASSPALDEKGNLYLAVNNCHASVSPAGQLRSSHSTDVPIDPTPLVSANNRIYLDNPWLHLGIEYPDGSEEWGFTMTLNLVSSPNMDRNGIIYASDGDYLFALRPKTSAPPAKSSWPMWRADSQHTGLVELLIK